MVVPVLDFRGTMLAFQVPDGFVDLFRRPGTMTVVIVVGLRQQLVSASELFDQRGLLSLVCTGHGRRGLRHRMLS